jgi:hypothetical protein
LRILHVDTGAEMRGGQHQVLLLLRLLRDAGHENVLLAQRDSPLFRAACDAGFTVSVSGLLAVYGKSRRVDIVHAHDARAHALCAAASGQKFVVSRRVAFPVHRGILSRWKYGRANRYLAVSNFVAQQLQAAGVAHSRINIVYDAVQETVPGIWDPSAPAVALDSDDPGKCRSLAAEAARRAGIPIVFSSDLPRDLARASMFVYLTRSEGLGSAAILALAMGIPVVASRIEGLAEVFQDEVSGLYTVNDAQAAAAAMRRILDTPGLGLSLTEAGRQRAQTEFSARRMLEGTIAAYRQVLND